MNPILAFFLRMFAAVPVAFLTWLLSLFAFDYTLWFSTALSLMGGFLTYIIMSAFSKYSFLKRHRLSRKEYQYIHDNLTEAKRKIYRLHKALLSIRHIPSFSQRIELSRLTRKIYGLTKKEPKRFYQAETFYFSHLDTAVELSEKYALLAAQPAKTAEMDRAVRETRQTLDELNHLIEEDLYHLLSNDMDQLQFELDVAKQSIKKGLRKNNESGRLK
ncbi:5-bromo-4-chloroindolyl phosphate hydrolysis family protein [Ammoniphilus sp. 3BR4]|uniref:5-bromo-4-chloroindolyl phosphate hydrolysis family protein n=1 Tax=Ammoniphilus sp. 3BR4 TaxID=3158265 RepID=UPI003465D157